MVPLLISDRRPQVVVPFLVLSAAGTESLRSYGLSSVASGCYTLLSVEGTANSFTVPNAFPRSLSNILILFTETQLALIAPLFLSPSSLHSSLAELPCGLHW